MLIVESGKGISEKENSPIVSSVRSLHAVEGESVCPCSYTLLQTDQEDPINQMAMDMRKRRDKFIFLFIASASFALSAQVARTTDAPSIDLGMKCSQAIINALDRLREDGYKTGGYRIIINHGGDEIEVVFVPRLTSDDPLTARASNLPEVHYYLDSSGKSVVRRLLGK